MLSLVGQYKTRAHFEGKPKHRTDISHQTNDERNEIRSTYLSIDEVFEENENCYCECGSTVSCHCREL